VRLERVTPASSGKRDASLFIACAVLALCFSQAALAQSGRNRRERVEPPAPASVEPQAEPAAEPLTTKTPVVITSVIVGGDIIHDSDYFRSNYVDIAVKACIDRFKEGPMLTATKGGKLTRKAAVEWAKRETSAYVLWLEIHVKERDYIGHLTVSYIKYFVFMPQTAEVMAEGQIEPSNQTVRINGARVPTINQGSLHVTFELERGGQMVAEQVRRKLHY
jgi:hypothetical protein